MASVRERSEEEDLHRCRFSSQKDLVVRISSMTESIPSQTRLRASEIWQVASIGHSLLWKSKVPRFAIWLDSQSTDDELHVFPAVRPAPKTSRGEDLGVLAACTQIPDGTAHGSH